MNQFQPDTGSCIRTLPSLATRTSEFVQLRRNGEAYVDKPAEMARVAVLRVKSMRSPWLVGRGKSLPLGWLAPSDEEGDDARQHEQHEGGAGRGDGEGVQAPSPDHGGGAFLQDTAGEVTRPLHRLTIMVTMVSRLMFTLVSC